MAPPISPDLITLYRAGLIPQDQITYGHFSGGNWFFDAAVYFRSGSDRLIVMMPSARSSVGYAPEYLRMRWAYELPGFSLITVEDPTCRLAPMNAGWFLGSEKSYALEGLHEAIVAITRVLAISTSRVLFYGSSSGGLSALQLASLCDGSSAVAEIPTFDLSRTFWPGAVTRALRPGYPGRNVEEVMKKTPERISALHMFAKNSRVPNHLVLHCARDLTNEKEVYRYLMDLPKIASRCRSSGLMLFETHLQGNGHSALSIQAARIRIMHFAELSFPSQ